MAELHLTARELEALVGDALRARLKAAGFAFDRPMDARLTEHDYYAFPLTLPLGGAVSIVQSPDGKWIFQQTSDAISSRLHETFMAHAEAIARQKQPPND